MSLIPSSESMSSSLWQNASPCPENCGAQRGAHNEPWTLAHSLSDLAGASQAYLRALPSILDSILEGDELVQALLELTAVLEHMHDHFEDPIFLRAMFDPLRDEWAARERSRK